MPPNPRWIRVRDLTTGVERDIDARALPAAAGVEVIKDYPPNFGRHPRPAKPHVAKDGKPKARTQAVQEGEK